MHYITEYKNTGSTCLRRSSCLIMHCSWIFVA